MQYLGSHSYHLDRSFYNNTPLPGTGRGQFAAGRIKKFGGPIRTIANDLIANYESMSVIFRQRMHKGLHTLRSATPGRTRWTSTPTPTAEARR